MKTVVHGPYFHRWLTTLPGNVLAGTDVDRLVGGAQPEGAALRKPPRSTPRPSVSRVLFQWVGEPCVGAALALLALRGVTVEHRVAVLVPLWLLAGSATVPGIRSKSTRHVAFGWAQSGVLHRGRLRPGSPRLEAMSRYGLDGLCQLRRRRPASQVGVSVETQAPSHNPNSTQRRHG